MIANITSQFLASQVGVSLEMEDSASAAFYSVQWAGLGTSGLRHILH
jgi:hypothetical protein